MLPLEQIAQAIDPEYKTNKTHKNNHPTYSCRCPVHKGGSFNCNVALGDTGKPIINCIAYGCETADILAASNLPWEAINGDSDTNVAPIKPRLVERPLTNENTPYARIEYEQADSDPEAIAAHPYYIAKFQRTAAQKWIDTGEVRVGAPTRMGGRRCLIVPRYAIETGEFVGAEFIQRSGKDGKRGFGRHGVFYIGNPKIASHIYVAEGWATGVTAACTFGGAACSAVLFGNTRHKQDEIAALREMYPHATIVELFEGEDDGSRDFAAQLRICTPKGDINDYFERGYEYPEAIASEPYSEPESNGKTEFNAALFDEFCLTPAEIDALQESEWLIDNLVMHSAINAIVAEPGAGKTTVMEHAMLRLAKQRSELHIAYVNADTTAGAVKTYGKAAALAGVQYLTPDLKGGGLKMEHIVAKLEGVVADRADMSSVVWVFDTLKKCTDVLSKRDNKAFFNLLRNVCGLGGTVILLGHTNKYPDKETGLHVYEGTGDLKADCDLLLYLDMDRKPGEKVDEWLLSTREEKCRGIRKDITIRVRVEADADGRSVRHVELLDDYIDVAKKRADDHFREDNNTAIEAITDTLRGKRIKTTDLYKSLHDSIGIGRRTADKVLNHYLGELWQRENAFERNIKYWSLIEDND